MTTIGRLDSYFTNLLYDVMSVEQQPLARLQTQRDSVNVLSGVYSDLDSRLSGLKSQTRSLISSDAFYALKAGRTVSVGNTPTDTNVLTASASSSTVAGQYDVHVTQLALAERKASAVQTSIDQALGKSGKFWLGGTGTASASATPNTTISDVSAGTIYSEFRELGTGAYTIETRDNNGVLQFRLKDADGSVVAIADKTQTDHSLTTGWQTLTAGEYDTQRGLVINFSGAAADASTSINYTAAGVGIDIAATDTLINIANKINDAVQPEGRDVSATVVGKQLVLTAARSGESHTMLYTDSVGLGGFSTLQAARNASFTVNTIAFSRAANTNLTDVISGVTLNLAADAEGNDATLTIAKNFTAARSAIDSFVTQFNDTLAYLEEKTTLTKGSDGVYTRGALADDIVFSNLRSDLLERIISSDGTGVFKSLREIGLTINDSLQVTVSDSDKLEDALGSHPDEAAALLDKVMGDIATTLGRYTGDNGSSGYIDDASMMIKNQLNDLNNEVENVTERLVEREQYYVNQFAEMQTTLLMLQYTQQMMSGVYGSVNSYG